MFYFYQLFTNCFAIDSKRKSRPRVIVRRAQTQNTGKPKNNPTPTAKAQPQSTYRTSFSNPGLGPRSRSEHDLLKIDEKFDSGRLTKPKSMDKLNFPWNEKNNFEVIKNIPIRQPPKQPSKHISRRKTSHQIREFEASKPKNKFERKIEKMDLAITEAIELENRKANMSLYKPPSLKARSKSVDALLVDQELRDLIEEKQKSDKIVSTHKRKTYKPVFNKAKSKHLLSPRLPGIQGIQNNQSNIMSKPTDLYQSFSVFSASANTNGSFNQDYGSGFQRLLTNHYKDKTKSLSDLLETEENIESQINQRKSHNFYQKYKGRFTNKDSKLLAKIHKKIKKIF